MKNDLPTRWPLVTNPKNRGRGSDIDARLINAYVEKDPQLDEWQVVKRPAARSYSGLPNWGGPIGGGITHWNGSIYGISGTPSAGNYRFYKGNTSLGTIDHTKVRYWFQPMASSPPTLFFGNRNEYYITEGSTITPVSDGVFTGFAADLVAGIANLNGRAYVMTRDCEIYGATNLNDASAWSSLNVIVADQTAGQGQALIQHLNYILAVKDNSIEVFQDVGNPTGSPLGKVPGVLLPYGTVRPETFASVEGDLLWVGSGVAGGGEQAGKQVIRMRGLDPVVISTPEVERLIDYWPFVYGSILVFQGHRFYCLSCTDEIPDLLYDLEEGVWLQMKIGQGGTKVTIRDSAPFGLTSQLFLSWDGKPYSFDSTSYEDGTIVFTTNVPITVDIYTPNLDFGTDIDKQLNALFFTGDQNTGCKIYVRYSDDDYKTWSDFREVDLSVDKPFLTDEGTFTRRAYHIRHESPTPFRLRAMGLRLEACVL